MKKNRNYHHGNLRSALIAEAQKAIVASGEGGLSLRACARDVGVDVAAAYRHFRNKNEVVAAVAAEGFHALGEEMQAALAKIGRVPEKAEAYFICSGTTYIHFGLNNRNMYQLMFSGRCTAEAVAEQREKSYGMRESPPFVLLSDALDLLVEALVIPTASREQAEFFAWSSVHGFVSLLSADRGKIEEEAIGDMAVRCCQTILWGLDGKKS